MLTFKRIDRRLLFWFLLLIALPLGISTFIAYNNGARILKQQTVENLRLATDVVKGHVYTFIQTQTNIAKDFSSDHIVIQGLKRINHDNIEWLKVIEELDRHLTANKLPLYSPYILSISVLNGEGIVISSTEDGLIGSDESDKDWFIRTRRGGYFGDMYYSAAFYEPVIDVSVPVMDNETGTLLGVIVNTISGSTLANITHSGWAEAEGGGTHLDAIGGYFYGTDAGKMGKKATVPLSRDEHVEVYIVNKDKRMITESRFVEDAVLNQAVDTEPVRKALTGGEEMVGIYTNYRGVPIIGASIFIRELRWVILAERDIPSTFATLFRLKVQMITLGIVVLCAVIFASSAVSKKFTNPVRRLLEATRRQSAGELTFRVTEGARDEIGTLAASFNKMCDDVQKITVSRDYFEKILRGMNESLIVIDMDYTIRSVNLATLHMLGYSEMELIGKPISAIIKEKLQYFKSMDSNLLFSDNIFSNVEVTCKTRYGSDLAVSLTSFFSRECRHKLHVSDCKMLKIAGSCFRCKDSYIVNIAHDITQHKQTEEGLRRSKEAAEYTARVRSDFLASMSHEIRTPLNAILGMAEALQEGVFGAVNERQLKSLHTIEEGGRHLLSLINDILDVSKIEAGRFKLELRQVSVKSVCQASLIFIKQEAHKKRIKITTILGGGGTTVWADERRLKQILVNLLSNAVKFTPDGGAVGLAVVEDVERQVVNFTVWDTGIGISGEHIGQLFSPFTQLDGGLSHTGTGLGLALVRQLTELHGGSVSVESEGVGSGSRFTVTLQTGPSGWIGCCD